MNHIVTINHQALAIRQSANCLILSSLPTLATLHKCYSSCNFSYLNHNTLELLCICKNTLSVFKPTLFPLELTLQQQAFLEWEPHGGLILKNTIILYDSHAIVFYLRGVQLEKTLEIDIVQTIQSLQCSLDELSIAMKAISPCETIFLWNLEDLQQIKPKQEITLAHGILQWQFLNNFLLILTANQFRAYCRQSSASVYLLQHFYEVKNYSSFCMVGEFHDIESANRKSVNTLALINRNGHACVLELYDLGKQTRHSTFKQVCRVELTHESIKMCRIIAGWQHAGKVHVVCENKLADLFMLSLDREWKVATSLAYEQFVGVHIVDVHSRDGYLLSKEAKQTKLLQIDANNGKFKNLRLIDSDKSLLASNGTVFTVKGQTINRELLSADQTSSKGVEFKYSNLDAMHYLFERDSRYYFIVNIRYFKYTASGDSDSMVVAGIALRNDKAQLLEVRTNTQSLLYRLSEQYLLLTYALLGDKITTKTIKSSPNKCIYLQHERYAELLPTEIHVGEASGSSHKVLTVFPLSRVYKMLDLEMQYECYQLEAIPFNGLVLILKNYAFFMQFVEDENGFDLVVLKKMGNILYKRFPMLTQPRLLNAQELVFWAGKILVRSHNKLHGQIIEENPYALPDTLIRRQLETKVFYALHHPKSVRCFIETSNISQLVKVLLKVREWMMEGAGTAQFYRIFDNQFFMANRVEASQNTVDTKIDEGVIELLEDLAQRIIDNPGLTFLKQNNPLLLENQIQAIKFVISNPRSIDYYSQSSLALFHSSLKNSASGFKTMQIAHLLHSLNKEEAVSFLKGQKVDWNWIQKYSIVLWYHNKQEIKKWVEEIAANEFRVKKDPFDCLFWYVLCGKRNILLTLFKSQKFDSKEHQAMNSFLQRDFTQPKDQSAAIKNAYVLIDKKRYLHALAFFVLGGKVDDCIRFALDRLKDLNLAYLFCLLAPDCDNQTVLNYMLDHGDIWIRHTAYFLQAKHVKACNALFDSSAKDHWQCLPALTGYHPAAISFASKMGKSIEVRRELQTVVEPTADSLDRDVLITETEPLKAQAIKYCSRIGIASHGLLLAPSDEQCLSSYELQQYKMMGKINPSVMPIISQMEDIQGLLANYLQQEPLPKQLFGCIADYRQKFLRYVQQFPLKQFKRIKKQWVGELMHFSYHSENIIAQLSKPSRALLTDYQVQLASLRELQLLAMIILELTIGDYTNLHGLICLLTGKETDYAVSEEYWSSMKSKYDRISEYKKYKGLKQMDQFEHAFVKVQRQEDRTDKSDIIYLDGKESCSALFKLCLVSHLSDKLLSYQHQLRSMLDELKEVCQFWIVKQLKRQIEAEYVLLTKQGAQIKLKLTHLSAAFEDKFAQMARVIELIKPSLSFIQNLKIRTERTAEKSKDKGKQKEPECFGIEIFRNKQEVANRIVLNCNEGRGLECLLMFKKLVKKIQICDNLINRDRLKDTSLISDESVNTTLSAFDFDSVLRNKQSEDIEDAYRHILECRDKVDCSKNILRRSASYSSQAYFKPLEQIPYFDYNEMHSLAGHSFLPFYFIGGKSVVEVCGFNNLKNFNRMKCPGMLQICKMVSKEHRLAAMDSHSLSIYHFDAKFVHNCVFTIKKPLIDFCMLNPSIVGTVDKTGVSGYDTLLHPKRQSIYKIGLTNQPLAIETINSANIAVLRKNQLLIYDIRTERLKESKEIRSKARSFHVAANEVIYVGQNDSKVKTFQVGSDLSTTFSLGTYADDKQRQKVAIEGFASFMDVAVCLNNEGSLFYLPRVQS